MGNNHAVRECQVFTQFLAALGTPTHDAVVEKRKPPEPDILYRPPNRSVVAYELVELLDEEYAGRLALLFGTKTALQTHFTNLSAEVKARFERKYGDALLYFRFLSHATMTKRRNTIRSVFDKLLELSDGIVGDVLVDDPDLTGVLSSVSVSRGSLVGPIFEPESVGWIGDPTVFLIRQKFAKTYRTSHPIELLAYIDRNPVFPDDVWIGNIREFIDAQSRPLPFRKIWIFDCRNGDVRYQCSG